MVRLAVAAAAQERALTTRRRPRTASFKRDNELCEYDLDNDDEDWLVTYNGAQNRLPAERYAAREAPPALGLLR